MLVLSDAVAANLINSRCFKTNVHKLANRLRISDVDVQTDIYFQLTAYRLKNYTEERFVNEWNDKKGRELLEWQITHAKQDVQHSFYAKYEKENDKKERLKMYVPTLEEIRQSSEPTVIDYDDDSDHQLSELLLDNLRKIFPKSETTYRMVSNILNNTEQYSRKELNQLLCDVRKACNNNRTTLDNIFNVVAKTEYIERLKLIDSILAVEKSTASLDDKNKRIQMLFDNNTNAIDDLIDECKRHNPKSIGNEVTLIRHWNIASPHEQIAFIDFLEHKQQELTKRIGHGFTIEERLF
ncbi:hypothetical protein ACWCL1_04955 [Ligilactobacillus sp. LYQ135]